MTRLHLLLFGLLGLLFQCNQSKKGTNEFGKVEQIFAENNYDLGGSAKLNIYADSTYEFTVTNGGFDHEKIDKFKGSCYIKNDTIYFKPFAFKYVNSGKAIIKNNFVEFIEGEYPLKVKIRKSNIAVKQTYNLGQFNGFSIFTYDKKFYNYFIEDDKPYELTQKDLIELDKLLEKCFDDNKSELNRKSNLYEKQIIAVINNKKEIEVWVSCNCRERKFNKEFEYQIVRVNDGGNCHFTLKINLTRQNYSDLSINGDA